MTFALYKPGQSGNPAGRRKKPLPRHGLELIEQLAAKGCREIDIGRAVGMSPPTWIDRKNTCPEIQAAFDSGRQRLHDELVNVLVTKAKKGDVVPLLFALKTLFNYREDAPPPEMRAQVVINLQAAMPAERYTADAIDVTEGDE